MRKTYVIIPVYRAELFLEEAVVSVLAQIHLKTEIILVDDGSPDRSGELCDELARKHPGIFVLHQKNGGVSVARNTGIEYVLRKACKEDYIAFLDADDFWLPGLAPMEPMDTDLIAFSSAACNQSGKRFRLLHRFSDDVMELGGGNLRWINHGTFASFFYRVSLVQTFRLRFLEGVRENEDVIFWRQASFCARSVRFSSQVLYAYRHNTASVTHSVRDNMLHIPRAWHAAAAWADRVPCLSAEERLRWRQECERICGARLLEAARLMAAGGCSSETIRSEILQDPLARHLYELTLEDLAQWQREDLLLILDDVENLVLRHRRRGMLLPLAQSLLRLLPLRYVWEIYRFPLRSLT